MRFTSPFPMESPPPPACANYPIGQLYAPRPPLGPKETQVFGEGPPPEGTLDPQSPSHHTGTRVESVLSQGTPLQDLVGAA